DARDLEILETASGGEVQPERDRTLLARHQPPVATVGELHDLRREGLELGIDVRAPRVGRYLEVRVGGDDLVRALRTPFSRWRSRPAGRGRHGGAREQLVERSGPDAVAHLVVDSVEELV